MTGLPRYEQVLLVLNIAAPLVLLLRLVSLRLVKSYPALCVYLSVSGLLPLISGTLGMDATGWAYANYYMAGELLSLILYVVMVLELYGAVLQDLTGIASAARKYVSLCIVGCVTGSLLAFAFEKQPRFLLERFFAVDRALVSSIALFVLLITGFLVWFPVRVPRNAVVYSIGYAMYLVPRTMSLLIQNSGSFWRLGGIVAMIVEPLSLLMWAVVLSRSGEKSAISIARHWAEDDKVRIIAELASINNVLARVRRESI